jgi:hypothetical protein
MIRQEPERPEMQNIGDKTKKGGEGERGQKAGKPYAKPKGRCGCLGVSRKKVARIQEDAPN